MKARIGIAVVAALSGASLVYTSQGDAPPDLTAYIAEIKRDMMSEDARSALRMIAGIRVGQTDLKYSNGSSGDRYSRSYRSTTCPRPGADPDAVAEWHAALGERVEEEVERLRAFADSDSSGFVSTTEGRTFRRLVEFGYLVKQIIQVEGRSIEAVSAAAGLTAEEAGQQLQEFDELASRMADNGLRPLPDVRDP